MLAQPQQRHEEITVLRPQLAVLVDNSQSMGERVDPKQPSRVDRAPTHPGEMLLEEFLKPLDISQSAFAIQLGVSFPRLNEVINAKRSVTPDTALRLAQVTGMSADFWLGLQQDWDSPLGVARSRRAFTP